jgi:hypothetical protein
MKALDLIDEVRHKGGTLFLAGDELKYRGPRDAMTDKLRAMLRRYKPDLVRLLTETATHREGPPYPDGLSRVKCFYCENCEITGTKATCRVSRKSVSGIALLISCSDFTLTTVH